MKLLGRVSAVLYRLGIGRRAGATQILLLTTKGAKTAQVRTHPLAWFPDGEEAWLVVASFGGSALHPAWYRNLVAHPEQVSIEVGNRKLRVTPQLLEGPEREDRWGRIVAAAPNFGDYAQRTDRVLPVVRLTPAV